MIIYTEQKTASTWFWTIHNAATGVTYQLTYNVVNNKIRLSIIGTIDLHEQTALEFWAQLAAIWEDAGFHSFVGRSLHICKEVLAKETNNEKR